MGGGGGGMMGGGGSEGDGGGSCVPFCWYATGKQSNVLSRIQALSNRDI